MDRRGFIRVSVLTMAVGLDQPIDDLVCNGSESRD